MSFQEELTKLTDTQLAARAADVIMDIISNNMSRSVAELKLGDITYEAKKRQTEKKKTLNSL